MACGAVAFLLLASLPRVTALAQVAVVTRNVNLRIDPSVRRPPIRLLRPPTELELLDPDATRGFYHVMTLEGEDGWVWRRNVRVDADAHLEDLGEEAEIPAYRRADWRHWLDADRDCQNTRDEVLIRDSEVTVTFAANASGRPCVVVRGRWTDPYGTRVFTDPGDLDIDHVVPLQNAHLSGGWAWDAQRRAAYANDLTDDALLAVSATLNRQKGSNGPEQWLPPDATYGCTYARTWEGVKARWKLTMTTREAAVVDSLKASCP